MNILKAAAQKAMNHEIMRQIAENTRKHEMELDAVILWQLHEQLGLGPIRLRRFYDTFGIALRDLVSRYEMDDTDQIWLCTHKLKEYGIDLEEWQKESNMT